MAKKLGGIVCILDDDEPLVLRGNCPNIQQHTPSPEGYNAWHSWAAQMSKTHKQQKCPSCGLYAIWEPKPLKRNRKEAMSYHDRIMNLCITEGVGTGYFYQSGHRDARRAATEIANEADTRIAELEAQFQNVSVLNDEMNGRLADLLEAYEEVVEGDRVLSAQLAEARGQKAQALICAEQVAVISNSRELERDAAIQRAEQAEAQFVEVNTRAAERDTLFFEKAEACRFLELAADACHQIDVGAVAYVMVVDKIHAIGGLLEAARAERDAVVERARDAEAQLTEANRQTEGFQKLYESALTGNQAILLQLETAEAREAKLLTALKSLCFDAREVLTLVEPEYQHGCRQLQTWIEQCEALAKQDAQ